MPWFAKFDGVDGSSVSQHHERWMDLMSFSQSVVQASSSSPIHVGVGELQECTISKSMDKGSPTLFLACCKGRVFAEVLIDMTRSSGTGQEEAVVRLRLERVRITGHAMSGDAGSSAPTEQLSLNYEKITYNQLVPGGFEEMFWDFRANTGGGGQ
ncbi:MAG: type VI secretion system tube protein Hcp [Fimbriimonadaceae bacterium]